MKYPIGIQTFEQIIEDRYVYVDKTALVYNLVRKGGIYFLSRPRRFGKSLLLSTLKSYYQGKKELFKGLGIEKLEKEWKRYPIFHIDFNGGNFKNPGELKSTLVQYMEKWEGEYGLESKKQISIGIRFREVLEKAHEQTGQRAVVLVDEYDKPLLQAIQNEPLLDSYRSTLKAFYGVLKSADRYLRFAFLTGVTKFSQVSVFSDLNQLNDISLNYDFSTLCGITREELLANFEPEIAALSQANDINTKEVVETMTRQYDGYHFHPNGEGVFNPFSVLNAFFSKEFGNYWFQTGTPTFLVELLKESDYDLRLLMDGIETAASAFTEYRADRKNPIPLIYQSGYLTIKDYDKRFKMYRLGFPNDEVRYGFLNFLLPFYTAVTDEERSFYIGKFIHELESGNVDAFMHRFEAFFADFPYELNDQTERHYQVIIYLIFKLMGQFTQAEVHSSRGRADAVVRTPKFIYIFEFKLNGTVEQAMEQIEEKGYAFPYTAEDQQVIKVGVEFSAEKRNVERWMVAKEI